MVKDASGKPLGGPVVITFSLYATEEGGAPLWLETQSVQADSQGRYSAFLGAAEADGLPADLFVSGEARWLGVRPEGQAEQPRIQLMSVPYALKAHDAETIGGLPPSAFVLAAPAPGPKAISGNPSPAASVVPADASPAALGGSGTVNFVPLWTPDGNTLGNSVLFQSGSGSSAKIGINTNTPGTTLDIKGSSTVRGSLNLPATATATAASGKNSQPQKLTASAFNSGTSAAVNQNFQWQAEPLGNNTTNPSGTLNLLFGSGTNSPAETGLSIASNGQITFAPGQTFLGGGGGTITGVTAGTDLTGGGTSGSVTLNVDTTKVVTGLLAGTDLTGGGTGGVVTLNLDTTKVPLLSAANNFIANQSVTGSLTATGAVTGSTVNATTGFDLGGTLFDYGSLTSSNAFLGFAGNVTTTGLYNTAVGELALSAITNGQSNSAIGLGALRNNTTGTDNAASGVNALADNTTGGGNVGDGTWAMSTNSTGTDNTGIGYSSGQSAMGQATTGSFNTFVGAQTSTGSNLNLSNATAVGALAEVDSSNSMVLGSINGLNNATANTNVGIGITAPVYPLHVGNAGSVPAHGYFRVEGPTSSGSGLAGVSFGGNGDFQIDAPGIVSGRFVVKDSGLVGIADAFPSRIFQIGSGKGHALADGWDVYSSRRWKTNIRTLDGALGKVEQLRGVSYDLKASGKHEIGVIAEEVGQVLPEVVSYEANSKDAQGVDYSRLTALLIQAVKEQQQQIRTQQRQIRLQEKRAQAQWSEIAMLHTQLRRQGAANARLESRLLNLERNQATGATKVAQYENPMPAAAAGNDQ